MQALRIHVKEERRTSSNFHMYSIAAGAHTSYADVDNDADALEDLSLEHAFVWTPDSNDGL